MTTKRTRRRGRDDGGLKDEFVVRRNSNTKQQVQIISHGRPVSHIVITDDRGGAVKVDADFLPSVREVLEHIRLINDSLGERPEGALPN